MQDPTYYLGLLREKNAEPLGEIEKSKKEKEEFEKDTKLYTQYKHRLAHDKERSGTNPFEILEGQLADLNLAHDKHRSGTNPFEILRFQKHVREHNKSLQKMKKTKLKKHIAPAYHRQSTSEHQLTGTANEKDAHIEGGVGIWICNSHMKEFKGELNRTDRPAPVGPIEPKTEASD